MQIQWTLLFIIGYSSEIRVRMRGWRLIYGKKRGERVRGACAFGPTFASLALAPGMLFSLNERAYSKNKLEKKTQWAYIHTANHNRECFLPNTVR